ncbi:unnamed protein product [Chironomus riparius]|uniref:arginine kinase n=1 Tax=Chironomus riparius TaxID=315576 RepID=A0A9N9RZU5_9DIPT|nr:unnamed protein product [Chironomus riparius]
MEGHTVKSPSLEEKRQEFRKYLESTGVTEKLTNALMKLYQHETKPEDPIAYIRKQLCEDCPDVEKVVEMQTKIDELVKEKKQAAADIAITKSQVKKTASEIDLIINTKYQELKAHETGNSLLKEYLTDDNFEKLKALKTDVNGTLLDNIQSGLNNFDSDIGIFASDKNAYDVFDGLFAGVLEDFHEIEGDTKHPESKWGDSHELEDLDPESNFIKSIRIVIGRALKEFEYMPLLTVEKFEKIEEKIRKALIKIDDEEYKGTYHTLSSIEDDEQKKWIEDGTLFPEPEDKFLKAAETFRCWPKGRGIFKNEKNNVRAWINVEEHVQFISVDEGANLQKVYERLNKIIELVGELEFAKHERWGYLAHNLKNIGNTMRIIVKVKIPKLSLEENSNKFETLLEATHIKAKNLGSGYYELMSTKRVGLTEIETARDFQKGIKEIITAEKCLYL